MLRALEEGIFLGQKKLNGAKFWSQRDSGDGEYLRNQKSIRLIFVDSDVDVDATTD